jgi:hypothetical protein
MIKRITVIIISINILFSQGINPCNHHIIKKGLEDINSLTDKEMVLFQLIYEECSDYKKNLEQDKIKSKENQELVPQRNQYKKQTDFDKLVLKDGTTYFGEYSKIEEEIVYFKPKDAFAFQPILINKIKRLESKGGHAIILGGVTFKKYQKNTDCLNGTIILGLIIYYFQDWFIEVFEDAFSPKF